jgi:formate hydrogenlyase subunit 3/multisubunit Na+/H+ antiporter MnhD subunit
MQIGLLILILALILFTSILVIKYVKSKEKRFEYLITGLLLATMVGLLIPFVQDILTPKLYFFNIKMNYLNTSNNLKLSNK